MSSNYYSIDPSKYYKDFLEQNVRPDGRSLEQFRPMSINVGSIGTADGSAIVKIENTLVVCGIKAELAKPKPETPDEGYLVANVGLPPLCAGKYVPGPPSEEAQVASKFLDETLKNSTCINLKDLCISRDNLAWCLYLDAICLNQDGSVLDACLIASIAALKTLKLPEVKYNEETAEKLVDTSILKPITTTNLPVANTFAVFENDKVISDPTAEEESLCTGTVTIVIRAESNEISGIRQSGTNPLTSSQLEHCLDSSKKKTKLILELIQSALGSPDR